MSIAINLMAYFQRLQVEHNQIEQFYYGDYDDILSAQHTVLYPCLWLETPDISYEGDSDNMVRTLRSSFVILKNSTTDDRAKKLFNSGITETIAQDIIERMRCDQESELFDFRIRTINMTPLPSVNSDNSQGWRVDFEVSPTSQSSNFRDNFSEVFPANSLAKFKFEAVADGDDYNITITNLVTPSISDFTFNWEFYDGTSTTANGIDENPSFTISTSKLYVKLEIEVNGLKLYASAHSVDLSKLASAYSLPLIYNPLS